MARRAVRSWEETRCGLKISMVSRMQNRADLLPLIHQVRDRMHPQHGSVWFRSCAPFQGEKGKMFAARASQQFGATAVGHTFNIHVWQSGTHSVEPGTWPDWPNDLGVRDRGKHKGELQISLPLRNAL